MPCKIVWSKNAVNTYVKNIKYLKDSWSEKEIEKFETACTSKLNNLSNHPYLGSSRNKNPNIRFTSINKRVPLIYHYKPRKQEIELMLFWNTAQNPRKLKNKN